MPRARCKRRETRERLRDSIRQHYGSHSLLSLVGYYLLISYCNRRKDADLICLRERQGGEGNLEKSASSHASSLSTSSKAPGTKLSCTGRW
jgi:hypothetical protein